MVVIEKRLMFRYSGTPMIIGMDIFWSQYQNRKSNQVFGNPKALNNYFPD